MRYLLLSLLLPLLAGCGVELLTTTAIQGELQKQNASNLTRQLKDARDTTSLLSAQQTVNAYQAEKGQYPPSLEALVPEWLPDVPRNNAGEALGYDPVTGRVYDGPVTTPAVRPSQPRVTDMDKIQQLLNGIERHAADTGRYPASLQHLVPYYLPQLPKTASNMDFLYDPRTGTVYHPNPDELAAQQAPAVARQQTSPPAAGQSRSGVGGGGGLLGETMTGIAIQQDLNNMSNAGTSAAGGRARTDARSFGAGQTDQQNQTMDDLGL
ncbi:MAG: hypothetical protein KJ052_14765 [Candidatus Hydrogenedentes bacterium]|nr:hypothetical protein [Candidatus Hydrogenedentota bacterium]